MKACELLCKLMVGCRGTRWLAACLANDTLHCLIDWGFIGGLVDRLTLVVALHANQCRKLHMLHVRDLAIAPHIYAHTKVVLC